MSHLGYATAPILCSTVLPDAHPERWTLLRMVRRENPPLEKAFELLPYAVLWIGEHGGVEALNTAARDMIEEGDGIAISEGGLAFHDQSILPELRKMLTDGPGRSDRTRFVALKRPSFRKDYAAFFSLLDAETLLLRIVDPERLPHELLRFTRQAWGFTPKEAELIHLLCGGQTLQEAANEIGITHGTARNHLKQAFLKTGTSSQSAVVATVLRSFVNVL